MRKRKSRSKIRNAIRNSIKKRRTWVKPGPESGTLSTTAPEQLPHIPPHPLLEKYDYVRSYHTPYKVHIRTRPRFKALDHVCRQRWSNWTIGVS